MYELRVETSFSAAHFLRGYKGKCENLHGHNWKVEAYIVGKTLDDSGMLMDFKDIKLHLATVVDMFDHQFVNEIPHFKTHNPSCEHIAHYIYTHLSDALKKSYNSIAVSRITVWETTHTSATYYAVED